MSAPRIDGWAGQGGPLRGELRVPGDKSVSHRALILGALATGESSKSEQVMIKCADGATKLIVRTRGSGGRLSPVWRWRVSATDNDHGLALQRWIPTVPARVAAEAPCSVLLVKDAPHLALLSQAAA